MENLNKCIEKYLKEGLVHNIAVRVGRKNEVLYDVFKSTDSIIDEKTMFDMASVTKIIVTTTLALMAIDRKLINLDDKITKFYTVPKDKTDISVKNLLTHTLGMGHKALNKAGYTYDNIAEAILDIPLDIKAGSDVIYSCPGFILLGKILEKVFGSRLDELFIKYVAEPLEMNSSTFIPSKGHTFVNSNLADCEIGIVNDYNCRFLGGVAGNAGLFSNISDITKYVKMLLNYGSPLINKQTFDEAIQNHTPDMGMSRGLGFLYVDNKYLQTGGLFSNGSIGHGGHTGQSVFVDTKTGFYVIILSDATVSTIKKYGEKKFEKVKKMRQDIHTAILADEQGNNLEIKF